MSSNFSLNEEQQEIVNLVLEGHNVIICGQAGVGKTHVINVLYKTIKQNKQNINITASTGIATLPFNGHATTLHTWCGLSARDGRFQTKDLIEQTQTLISSCSVGIHNYTIPMNTGDFTHTLNNMTFPEYTTNTRSYIMTYTDHEQWLYINIRSLPATLVSTRFTQLHICFQNTLKIHGRVLRPKPVTIDGFILVSHYYWGAGRPE